MRQSWCTTNDAVKNTQGQLSHCNSGLLSFAFVEGRVPRVRLNRSTLQRVQSMTTSRPTQEVISLLLQPDPPIIESLSWVEHYIAPREEWVSVLVQEWLGLSQVGIDMTIARLAKVTSGNGNTNNAFACNVQNIVDSLMSFGAIYTARLAPEIPAAAHLQTEVVQRLEESRKMAIAQLQDRGELDTMSQNERQTLQKAKRVLREDVMVQKYAYIRVHLCPKRFPIFHRVDWKKRVIAEGRDYVVINKPSGLPVPPTVDNAIENVLYGAELAIGISRGKEKTREQLYITTRIDHVTEGLVVVGKSTAFVQKFNKLVYAKSRIDGNDEQSSQLSGCHGMVLRKWYRAVVVGPVSREGIVHHDVLMNVKIPGLPFLTLVLDGLSTISRDTKKVLPCSMIIHDCEPVCLNEDARTYWGVDSSANTYELNIELLTGRTHQIRSQLSAIGLPILGDCLYKPLSSSDENGHERRQQILECFDNPTKTISNLDSSGKRIIKEPKQGIGLQAYKLEVFHDGHLFTEKTGELNELPIVVDAGPPSWRE